MQKPLHTICNTLNTECQVTFAPLCIFSPEITASLIISVINISFKLVYESSSVTTVTTLTDDRILLSGRCWNSPLLWARSSTPEHTVTLHRVSVEAAPPFIAEDERNIVARSRNHCFQINVTESSLYIVDVPISLSKMQYTLKALSWKQPCVLCTVALRTSLPTIRNTLGPSGEEPVFIYDFNQIWSL
jgi:hypothetical protein